MSTYESSKKVFEDVSSKKMSKMKEGSAAPFRDRHRRPDKQLYVPRALRKARGENVTEKKDSSNALNKHKGETSITDSHISSERTVNDSVFQKQEQNKMKIDKAFNSAEDEQSNVLSVEESDSVGTIKDSALFSIEDSVSIEEFHVTLMKQEQCAEDIKSFYDIAKNDVSDNLMNIRKQIEPTKLNDKMLTLNDKINLETSNEFQTDIQNLKSLNQRVHCDLKDDLLQDVVVSQIQDSIVQINPPENPEDSWETKFNDEGDCLDPKFVKELCDITGRIELAVAKNDYSDYQPVSRNSAEEYENIVELFGFPVEFSTQDLTSAFSAFQEASYNIKWVDDCHALAIFSSPMIASQALHLNHPFIKVRPLSEGIKESKEKARFCARMFEAHKPRPLTSAALARRLVSGALGLKVNASKEQRDIERNILREAKEKKKLKAKKRQDIWNGIVS